MEAEVEDILVEVAVMVAEVEDMEMEEIMGKLEDLELEADLEQVVVPEYA